MGAALRNAFQVATQLEQPVAAARRGLEIARAAGVTTIFNPSPADQADDALLALTDFVVPNEGEAEALCGFAVDTLESARKAGDALLARGVGHAIITLGSRGVLVHGPGRRNSLQLRRALRLRAVERPPPCQQETRSTPRKVECEKPANWRAFASSQIVPDGIA